MWGNQLGCGRAVEEGKCSTTLPGHGASASLHEQGASRTLRRRRLLQRHCQKLLKSFSALSCLLRGVCPRGCTHHCIKGTLPAVMAVDSNSK